MQKEVTPGWHSYDAASLRTAFGREGCPVCTLVLGSVQRYMDTWQYEGFTDVEHRHKLIQSRGFCPLHTWQLVQQHATSQLAIVYREVLTDVLDGLNRAMAMEYRKLSPTGESESWREPLWKLWKRRWHRHKAVKPAYEQCPLCRISTNAEERYIAMLLEQLRSEEIRMLLCQSIGLCLLHFTQARHQAEAAGDPLILRFLMECQRTCVQRVLEEVQESIRKHDYRFADEPRGDEMTAWRRAAKLCAGSPSVR